MLIVQLTDKGNIVHKMCEMYKSIDFSELDNTSYFYGQLVNNYEQEVDKGKFPSFSSFLNFNKKLLGPIFKGEHNEYRITEFVGLRSKMYCLVDKKNVVHNAAKGVPRNVVIDGERMSVKNIDLYKRVLDAESKKDVVIDGTFKRINNQGFAISKMEQTKTLMTCRDNKRWILDDNVHTLVFGHYRLADKLRQANNNSLRSKCLENVVPLIRVCHHIGRFHIIEHDLIGPEQHCHGSGKWVSELVGLIHSNVPCVGLIWMSME